MTSGVGKFYCGLCARDVGFRWFDKKRGSWMHSVHGGREIPCVAAEAEARNRAIAERQSEAGPAKSPT